MTPASCFVAIVLLLDVSGSVSNRVYAAQRDGVAAAFEDSRLVRTIERSDGIAVLMADFDAVPRTRLGWTLIRGGAEARAFAAALREVQRRGGSATTAIGRAILHAHEELGQPPCVPGTRLIDVSTDGFETDVRIPARAARDAAVADGVVINAIAFLDPASVASPDLPVDEMLEEAAAWLRENVATGFVRVARGPAAFEDAFRAKVIFEVTGLDPFAAGADPR